MPNGEDQSIHSRAGLPLQRDLLRQEEQANKNLMKFKKAAHKALHLGRKSSWQ